MVKSRDEQRTLDLIGAAELRVRRNPALFRLRDVILADWEEGDAHWQWVGTAPAEEIIDWALTVANEGDSPVTAKADLSTGDLAEMLGVDRRTVTGWCIQNQIEGAYQTPGGHWRIPAGVGERLRNQRR